jgi:hypothetical protein
MSQPSSSCGFALLLVCLAPGLHAQTLDQVCDPLPTTHAYLMVPERGGSTAPGDELYQNFIPTAAPLVRVDVKAYPSSGATFRVRILDPSLEFPGNELGSATTTTTSGGWIIASFAGHPVPVLPGLTYTIAVSSTGGSGTPLWVGAELEPYPAASPDPSDHIPDDKLVDVDWAFRTYSP